ncbi:MAG: bifunctional UDP-N-acetylmuramoyl-tripeptide:D-alanyl-D-alanine ligase/alanine racemase [Bacteroidales bacterium]
MTEQTCTVSEIATICHGKLHPGDHTDHMIRDLLIDSRLLIHPDNCLFVALVSERNHGYKYIPELYEKGVRCFMVPAFPWKEEGNIEQRILNNEFRSSSFIFVQDTLAALQALGAYRRGLFDVPVIGITGSNGKTIVKEWLFQLLSPDYNIIRSPKSYNSQIGVALSVWKLSAGHNLAIFEAGISRPGEMERLENIIHPTIGIFTSIGTAHDEHFTGQYQKVEEKLKLFRNAGVLIYCANHCLITDCLAADPAYSNLKTFTWGRNQEADVRVKVVDSRDGQTFIKVMYQSEVVEFSIPFTDEASIENALHCFTTELYLSGLSTVKNHLSRFSSLSPIAMRLELKEAINHCSLINDSYNSDFNSLSIALDFLNQQNQQAKKTIILSDLQETGREGSQLYPEIASLLVSRNVTRIIGIGPEMVKYQDSFPIQKRFFSSTEEFLQHFPVSSFQNETILLKGARKFEFERISQVLEQKAHETVMEINLDALIHNLNHFRAGLRPGVKTMAMVKAFSYGSGSYEIANVLQFHHVDYLAVAYADEGVELRKAGVHLPIMVMSPEEHSLDTLLKYNLEPEIYNLHIFNLLVDSIARNQTSIQQEVRIHIKLDTGMHRLGFVESELEPLLVALKQNPGLWVQSVFSHLAASEDPAEDDFTRSQIGRFKEMSSRITQDLDYPVLRHVLNSAGISRFPEAHFDMVRLGIGLYGVGSSAEEQALLRNVSTLKSVITQVKQIPAGETIGYNRRGKAEKQTVIAILPVGYADGLNRRLGNGHGKLYIHGKPVPIIGNVCMDLTMIDVTDFFPDKKTVENRMEEKDNQAISVSEGTEVVIFGDLHPVTEIARELGTIPYEVLTGISRRVKRIYYYE